MQNRKKPLQQKQTFFCNSLLFLSARLFLVRQINEETSTKKY